MDQKIKTAMAAVFEISSDDISEESSIETIPNWDSLKHIKLIFALEDEFEITFEEEEIAAMTSFSAIQEALGSK